MRMILDFASEWLIETLVGSVQFAFLFYLLLHSSDCDLPVARAERAKKRLPQSFGSNEFQEKDQPNLK